MEPQAILTRASDLLGEYGICRGHYAIDAVGRDVSPLDPQAVGFCSVGAVARACRDLGEDPLQGFFGSTETPYQRAVAALRDAAGTANLTHWNDSEATDDQIKATFAKAANIVQPEPSPQLELVEDLVAVG